mmetsp:Transcript_134782/g.234292  ORF Transcript_134782/g.234292 Transcript_134782/m.234292 type:complete len:312 (+) Transcript_134782:119-1054(+)
MSVTGYMYNINHTKKLGELELAAGLEGNRSWHNQFSGSAYVYIGGLHPGLTEGDIVIVFSQFGEIVDINLIRDKTTGKSKGFCFVCFEDQRSTILAVDNMNGYQLLNRTLRVDHVDKYKAPKRFDENEMDEDGDPKLLEYEATGAEGKGYQVFNVLDQQKKISEVASQRRKPAAGPTKPEDEDEAWAKAFEASLTMGPEEIFEKSMQDKKALKKEKAQLKKLKKQTKKLKMEAKRAKLEAQKKKQEKMKQKMAKKGPGASKQSAKGVKAVKSEESSESSSSSSSDSSSDSDSSADSDGDKPAEKQPKARRK